MLNRAASLALVVAFVAACSPAPQDTAVTPPAQTTAAPLPATTAAPPPTTTVTSSPPPPAPAGTCGVSTSDWCPAPPGDPCGAHKDTESCRSDPRCIGMRYRGESLIACRFDARGFATNCPTVGCVSR